MPVTVGQGSFFGTMISTPSDFNAIASSLFVLEISFVTYALYLVFHGFLAWSYAWLPRIFGIIKGSQTALDLYEDPKGFIFYMMSTPEDSEPKCSCGLSAKLRISRTFKNPYRLFYNCPKALDDQCEFFCWFDELSTSDDKPVEELNIIRDECIQLRQRLLDIQQERDNDRIVWNREKSELTSQLSTIQAEIDDIKKKIKLVNESDLMPPVDKLLDIDDGADDAVVIQTV